MADPASDTSPPLPDDTATVASRKDGNSLISASRNLWLKLGRFGRQPRSHQNCTPLTANAFKKMMIETICERALTGETYEADRDNWQPMPFAQWQQMYLKSYCVFMINDQRVSLTLFMRHWEHIVGQSLMFDPDNFMNDLNTFINDYGWFVESFTMPDQSVTVTFCRFNGGVMIRQLPSALYYFAAAWNKADIYKNGLLPTTSFDSSIRRRVAEYDVLFKTFNLPHIRSIAKNMYESAVNYSDSDDVSTNILRLIGHLPIIVVKINPQKIAENVWSKKSPVYDEDKESGIMLSYTYLPQAAFETVVHEDPIPNVLGKM